MSREAIIERERRWAVPAAVAAFAAVVLLVASLISRSGISSSSNSGVQLASFNDHPGALVFSSILSGAGFAIFALPLAYLFLAARARNPRIQPALIVLCFLGPVLIGVQGVINGFGLKSASSDYVAQKQRYESQPHPFKQFTEDLQANPTPLSKVNVYTDANTIEVENNDGSFYWLDYPQAKEKSLIGSTDSGNSTVDSSVSDTSLIGQQSNVDNAIDTGGKVGDALATHIADDNSTVKLASDLIFPAALAMIFAVVYTALQSYRVGLLTRFFGTLGMALGVSVVLLPFAPALIALWLGWLGLIFIDKVPGRRPPAWEAGGAGVRGRRRRPRGAEPAAPARGAPQAKAPDALEAAPSRFSWADARWATMAGRTARLGRQPAPRKPRDVAPHAPYRGHKAPQGRRKGASTVSHMPGEGRQALGLRHDQPDATGRVRRRPRSACGASGSRSGSARAAARSRCRRGSLPPRSRGERRRSARTSPGRRRGRSGGPRAQSAARRGASPRVH
jgi:hypothetical protein